MNQRTMSKMFLGGVVVLGLIYFLSASRNRVPNILMIVADDMGQTAGSYGDNTIATPSIDQLAKQGILFQNAYVTHSSCSPSRSSIMTGLYPHQNGQMGLAHLGFTMHRRIPNLVALLKRAGYRTFMAGKLHIEPRKAFPLDVHTNLGMNSRGVSTYRDHLETFIQKSSQPWFAQVSFWDPHKPYGGREKGLPVKLLGPDDVTPFPEFGEYDGPELRKELAGYYNAVKRVDHGVGLLIDLLERTGQSENTLVVFLGDHGPPVLRSKATTYELGTRIPFLLRWPDRIKAGQVHGELVSTVDILPTFLSAAGVPLPAHLTGRSLEPFFRGTPIDWRNYLFTEFTAHLPEIAPQRAVRDLRYKLIHNLRPGRSMTIIASSPLTPYLSHPRWKDSKARRIFRLMTKMVEYELYDLKADPLEHHNLAGNGELAKVEARMKSALLKWRHNTQDPLLDKTYFNTLVEHVEGTTRPNGSYYTDMSKFQETWPLSK